MSAPTNWVWSPEHQNYYIIVYDELGNPTCHWASQVLQPTPPVSPSTTRRDPGISASLASLVTAERIWQANAVPLDSSYFVRRGRDCASFFKKGRVFSMLYVESAGSTSNRNLADESYSLIQYGESAYSTIRRFVVVQVPQDKGHIYACGISTYSGRATTKPGCNPEDHAVIHFSNTAPVYYEGELERGMHAEAIRVHPAEGAGTMKPASRINFGKTVSIEKNVKVKDIGQVTNEDMSKLVKFWRDANFEDDDD